MNTIGSILLYYIIYIIASVYFIKADCSNNNKRIKAYIFCGVMVLSLFAGLRGVTVGWDTADTVKDQFEKVGNYNSLSGLMANRDHIKEPLYWFISFFLRKLTDNSKAFLFVMQLLTVGPIALIAYENRGRFPVSIIMTTYMLLFYQFSLNIIRQSIAASFLLLAFSKLMNKSYWQAGIFGLICCLFHNSGIIGVALILLLYIVINNRNPKVRFCLVAISIVLGVLFLTSWQNIINYMISRDILRGNYDAYVSILSGDINSKYNTFRYRNIVFEVLRITGTLFIVFILKGSHTGTEKEIRILKYGSILSLVIYSIINIVFRSYLADRGTLYLDYLQIILYASYYPKTLFDRNKVSKGRICIPKTGVQFSLIYSFGFNIIVYMIFNYGHTLPYHF